MQPLTIDRTDLGVGAHLFGKTFAGQNLTDVNGKKITYEDCDFSAAIIERGYFHGANFRKCKFIGTRFLECNFRQATFDQCTFDYSDFNRCVIPVPQLLANLPYFSNVRWELIHNLKANQRAIGDIRHDSSLVQKEIEAEIAHWKDVRKRPSSYYAKYDNRRDQTIAWIHCRRLWIERYVWGHGESLLRLSITTLAILFILSLLYFVPLIQETDSLKGAGIIYLKSIGFISKLFIDLPVVSTDVESSPVISTLAVFVRYIFIGMAIPVLYKKIAKR